MSGRTPKTRKRRADLSQHFLRSDSARRIVRATTIAPGDLVIEIGAGRGALTRVLAERTERLIALEIDPYLTAKLKRELAGRAQILQADFLTFDLPQEPYSVVGNIPYQHSMAFVRKLVSATACPRDIWLVVQREFAKRLCGQPFTAESVASLKLKPRWHLEVLEPVRRSEFDPPPSVESAVLQMRWRERPLVSGDDVEPYERLLDVGFSAPALRHSLRGFLSKVQLRRLAADYGFAMDGVPNALAFEHWLGIFRFLRRESRL